ncbi:MAG: MinD/ParA family protein [Deltaproteobacteria bacterium]|nr:MinD/ParA family protein [Deltaproteobacteria bacterium]MBW2050827.1 MinD/ParA family protein [Deltaproteobacteria bacterium]MBW2140051.1 MinD/ParA family protein [Deltaproteobacteria bacterium]MBW2322083.1 MinD/ParA family protein [Deltaproteobacteria bacterium]
MTQKQKAEARRTLETESSPVRAISITSGKGGVGKTNITANLAIALAQQGQEVLVWDADLGLANIDVLLGLNALYNINHLLNGEKTLEEIIIEGPKGIKIMPASSGVQEMANLGEGQKMRLLNELDHYRAKLDFLLIDTGAGISANVMYFNMAAQERIIVVTPEPTSITDAYALIKVMTTKYNAKKFRILVNLVENSREAKDVFTLLGAVADKYLGSISLDYLGFIPTDEYIPKSVLKQQPVLDLYPSAECSKYFKNLAKQLLNTPTGGGLDGNIKFLWKRLLKI